MKPPKSTPPDRPVKLIFDDGCPDLGKTTTIAARARNFIEKGLHLGIVPLLIFIVLWQMIAVMVTYIRGVPFPTPWLTAAKLGDLFGGQLLSDHTIYRHIADSLARWLIGFSMAVALGVCYGLAAGWSRRLEEATYKIVHLLHLIPGLAWIPVAILIFGIGEPATVFMITMAAFPPVAISVVAGVQGIDTTFVRAAQMMGANGRALFLGVLLPGSLPAILSGVRIGFGNSWRVLVAAEMIVGTGTGLGYSIIQARWTLDYSAAFACLGVICIIGLLFEQLVFNPLEKHSVERWTLHRDA